MAKSVIEFPLPALELLEEGLKQLGFEENDRNYGAVGLVPSRAALVVKLSAYIKELELFNAVFDLVGASTSSEQGKCDLVVRHILDSLSPWKILVSVLAEIEIKQGVNSKSESQIEGGSRFSVADVGSGAGFPGIPLAIIFPDISFSLIERMSKRCAFLENCRAMLGLKNVTVINSEVEKAPQNTFDLVAFRAFRPLDAIMLKTLLNVLNDGGILAAWKAKKEKIDIEMKALGVHWKLFPLTVPFLDEEERNLVIL